MQSFSTHEFRAKMKEIADKAVFNHEPIRVTRRNRENFIIISERDFAAEQETLFVLQNQSLMKQIAESLQMGMPSKQLTREEVRAEFGI